MNQAAQWYLQHEITKFQSQCDSAIARVRRARTIREAVQWGDVHCHSFIHSLVRTDEQRVERAVEVVVERFVKDQLELLANLPLDERKAARGEFLHRDWQFLRGRLPRLYQLADRESQRLLSPAA